MYTSHDTATDAEIYRGLTEVARRIPSPRSGKRTHPATITRWILHGVRLKNGQTLKLAAKRFPGGWAVSDDALAAFIDALTRDRSGEAAATSPTASRRKAVERAERELDRLGV